MLAVTIRAILLFLFWPASMRVMIRDLRPRSFLQQVQSMISKIAFCIEKRIMIDTSTIPAPKHVNMKFMTKKNMPKLSNRRENGMK